MFGGLLAHEKCIIQDKSWLDCMKPLPASYLIVSRSQWWGQSRLLASDLGLCSTLAEVWFAERWPHIQSPWQWQSIPPTRLWHHCKEKEMRRRKMKGGEASLALQNLCSIPAEAPTFRRQTQEQDNHHHSHHQHRPPNSIRAWKRGEGGGASRVRNWCSQQVPTSERSWESEKVGMEKSLWEEKTPSAPRENKHQVSFSTFILSFLLLLYSLYLLS